MRNRWIRRVVVCLILGVVTTVAVAWGCAVWIEPHPRADTIGGVGTGRIKWYVKIKRRAGMTIVSSFPHDPERHFGRAGPSRHEAYISEAIQSDVSAAVPHWSHVTSSDAAVAREQGGYDSYEHGYGWPWITMRCSYNEVELNIVTADPANHYPHFRVLADRIVFVTDDGFEHSFRDRTPGDGVRNGLLLEATRNASGNSIESINVLPLRPIWWEFAASSATWALCWAALLVAPLVVQWQHRLGRGRCPACGYDLRGELARGCPECGWRRELVKTP